MDQKAIVLDLIVADVEEYNIDGSCTHVHKQMQIVASLRGLDVGGYLCNEFRKGFYAFSVDAISNFGSGVRLGKQLFCLYHIDHTSGGAKIPSC